MEHNYNKVNGVNPKKTAEVRKIRAAFKAYLALKGMTQKQYARKKEVSTSFLSRVLHAKGPSEPLLKKIRKDLGPLLYSVER